MGNCSHCKENGKKNSYCFKKLDEDKLTVAIDSVKSCPTKLIK